MASAFLTAAPKRNALVVLGEDGTQRAVIAEGQLQHPLCVCVSGNTAYVVRVQPRAVAVVDLVSGRVTQTIASEALRLEHVAHVHVAHGIMYAAASLSGAAVAVDLSSMAEVGRAEGLVDLCCFAVQTDLRRVVVGCNNGTKMLGMDLRPLPDAPELEGLSARFGATAVLDLPASGELLVLEAPVAGIKVLNRATGRLLRVLGRPALESIAEIAVGMAMSADGRTVVVLDEVGQSLLFVDALGGVARQPVVMGDAYYALVSVTWPPSAR